jgi:two-component system phosphate regulon sensor histidine kinase PhoR
VEIVYGDGIYIPFYKKGMHFAGIADSLQTPWGIWLGGDLKANDNNLITSVSIEGLADRTYRTTFSLYIDATNRKLTILRRMMPTLALSLFSIIVVVLLFFITLRNWIRQKKLSEMKSDFINSITHEFHTPLAAIIVANKTLQQEKIAASPETVQPLTEVIQRQSERLKKLIGQVLDITTMNQVIVKKELHSVHHLLDELLLDYRLKLGGTPVELTLTKNASKDEVQLDAFWFTTVLLNIFDNAIKYNRQELKEITVTTFNDKRNLLISIADNGIGMTEETKTHLFDKFYRDTNMLTGEIKGLGLGLYYVKQAIDAHHWKIDIASEEGVGSTFTIIMPLA